MIKKNDTVTPEFRPVDGILDLARNVDQELLDQFERDSQPGVLHAGREGNWGDNAWSGDTWTDSHRR
jgi:hypothetical protein